MTVRLQHQPRRGRELGRRGERARFHFSYFLTRFFRPVLPLSFAVFSLQLTLPDAIFRFVLSSVG